MVWKTERISVRAGAGPAEIAALLTTLFAANNPMDILDVQFYQEEGFRTEGAHLLITYNTGGEVSYSAQAFFDTDDATVDSLVDAFFAATPTLRAHFIIDVTQERRRYLHQSAVVAIYSTTSATACAVGGSNARLVSPVANIAVGATGQANLLTATGVDVLNRVRVRNSFNAIWNAAQPGWAVLDLATCEWVGFPSCC